MIKSLNPEWNEEFPLVVKHLDLQALEITVWTGHPVPHRIWMHYVPLEDLIPEQQKTLTFDLLKDMDFNHSENNKSYGQLMIELMYKPVTCDRVLNYSEEANEMKKPLKVGGWLVVTILEAEDIQVTHPFVYVTIQNDRRQTKPCGYHEENTDKRDVPPSRNNEWGSDSRGIAMENLR
nr:C2 calcium-dependent membrane targeting [Tanacetum cinerariifolium]